MVGAAALWVVVVGGTSTFTWVAIDRAGRQVLQASPVLPRGLTPPAGTSSRPPTPTPTRPATSTPTPRRHGTPTPVPRPSPAASVRATAPPAIVTRAVDRAVRVDGAQLGVRCVGAAAALRFAQPDDGWVVTVLSTGPAKVTIRIQERGSGDPASSLSAVCRDGVPAFNGSGESERADR